MKPEATVALPKGAPPDALQRVKDALADLFSYVNFDYPIEEGLRFPRAKRFDRNGVDLGAVDGDEEAPSIAIFAAIQVEANHAFRDAIKPLDQ